MLQEHYERWNRMAPLGLILIGAGLSLVTHAAGIKGRGGRLTSWGGLGTVGLIVFNSGIAVFGDAVKNRMLYERALEELNP